MLFNLENFISQHVTGRAVSLLREDLDQHAAALRNRIEGRSVLVIGGAGTIGASFVKALLRAGEPARLYVADINENGLTELTRDLRSSLGLNIPEDYKTYPINFGDPVFAKLLRREGPFEIVANFAAHKHVRSEKDPYSIEAMIDNNVFRAKHLLDLLLEQGPEHFFCVSTDKAANPVNIMGASKKLMEEVILAYSREMPITTARFANVAFSNGSLPAGFLERLAKGQPLSAPLDIRRFFVSPEESGQICLLACLLGESGEIFFPKLDPQRDMQTFTHIADRLLETVGFAPHRCSTEAEARQLAQDLNIHSHPQSPIPNPQSPQYPVYYFPSDTSGEKPYEEFYTGAETLDLTRFAQLGVITDAPRPSMAHIEAMFRELRDLFRQEPLDKRAIVEMLARFIPNFDHLETGKSLDQKM